MISSTLHLDAADPAFDPEYPTDILDGHLVTRGGRAYLWRFCRRGLGEVWSLYEEDPERASRAA
jgi:hypothetical protein